MSFSNNEVIYLGQLLNFDANTVRTEPSIGLGASHCGIMILEEIKQLLTILSEPNLREVNCH